MIFATQPITLYIGGTLDNIRQNVGREVSVATPLNMTASPSPDELRIIREELDPTHLYI